MIIDFETQILFVNITEVNDFIDTTTNTGLLNVDFNIWWYQGYILKACSLHYVGTSEQIYNVSEIFI